MEYRVFYYCFEKDLEVPGNEPVLMQAGKLKALAEEVLCDEGDFVGILDAQETTLQFMAMPDGVWLEIPVQEERGSYGCTISFEKLLELLADLPREFVIEDFADFEFQAWDEDQVEDDDE